MGSVLEFLYYEALLKNLWILVYLIREKYIKFTENVNLSKKVVNLLKKGIYVILTKRLHFGSYEIYIS